MSYPSNRGGYNQNRAPYPPSQPFIADLSRREHQSSRDRGIYPHHDVSYPPSVEPRQDMNPQLLPFVMSQRAMTPQMSLGQRGSSPFTSPGSSESMAGQLQGMAIGHPNPSLQAPPAGQPSHGLIQSGHRSLAGPFLPPQSQWSDQPLEHSEGRATIRTHQGKKPSGGTRARTSGGTRARTSRGKPESFAPPLQQASHLPLSYPHTLQPAARSSGVSKESLAASYQGYSDPSGAYAGTSWAVHQSASSFPHQPMPGELRAGRKRQQQASATLTSLMTEIPTTTSASMELPFLAPETKTARMVTAETVVTKSVETRALIESPVLLGQQTASKHQEIIKKELCEIVRDQALLEFRKAKLNFGIPVADSLAVFVPMMSEILHSPIVSQSATDSGLPTHTTGKSDAGSQSGRQSQKEKHEGLKQAEIVSSDRYGQFASTQGMAADTGIHIARHEQAPSVSESVLQEYRRIDSGLSTDTAGQSDSGNQSGIQSQIEKYEGLKPTKTVSSDRYGEFASTQGAADTGIPIARHEQAPLMTQEYRRSNSSPAIGGGGRFDKIRKKQKEREDLELGRQISEPGLGTGSSYLPQSQTEAEGLEPLQILSSQRTLLSLPLSSLCLGGEEEQHVSIQQTEPSASTIEDEPNTEIMGESKPEEGDGREDSDQEPAAPIDLTFKEGQERVTITIRASSS